MPEWVKTKPKAERRRRGVPVPSMLILVVLLLASLFLASACEDGILGSRETLRGSGDLETQDYDFEGFNSIEISHAFVVTVAQSASYGVSVTVDDNVLDWLEVEQEGDKVKIGLKRTPSSPSLRNVTLKATVSMPQLESIEASGASRVTISGFSSGEDLSLRVSGASGVVGDIDAADADFEISGASKVELDGSAVNLFAEVSGASQLALGSFVVTDADVRLSGASDGTVNLGGRLDADLSGASELRYLGEPTLGDIDISGSSRIKSQ